MGLNVAQVVRQWALRAPARVAIIDRGEGRRAHTYEELDAYARAFAGELREAGCSEGDRVALFGGNDAAFLGAFMGIAYAGATIVPIPITSTAAEVRSRLEHARCGWLVHDRAREPLALMAAGGTRATPRPTRLLGSAAPIDLPADLSPEAIALVLYTSGTTDTPKGACITHASLATHTAALVHHELAFDRDTRALGVLPLTHSFGIRVGALAPFYAGGSVVLVPRYDPARSLEVAREERVTFIPAVPTMLAGWARTPRDEATEAWPELRYCLSAGAPLSEDVRARAAARLGAEIRQGYGLTEATFSCIDAPTGPARPGTVGRAVWGVEVAVVDAAGAAVPPGTDGEVVVRGQNVMARYLDDDEATSASFQNGFLRTGDIGRFERGALTIVDRTKDLILRGGRNVCPSEVERVLHEHRTVAEVAVVGVPDDYYGEEVVAVLRLVGGAELERGSLDALCRARLAAFKVPRAYATVVEMPLGSSGKVLKRVLREWLQNGTLPFEK